MHILDDGRAAIDVLVDGDGVGSTFFAAVAFVGEQGFGDYAVDGVRAGEGDERFGEFAHDAYGAAAVDEGDIVFVEGCGEGAGGVEVGGGGSGGGAAAGREGLEGRLWEVSEITYKTQTTGFLSSEPLLGWTFSVLFEDMTAGECIRTPMQRASEERRRGT